MIRSLALVLFCAAALDAQGRGDTMRAAEDPVIQRARQLAQAGREAEGRRLVDSVLRVTPPGNPLYAEALYWRASSANTAADAERDYRRLLIESPLSPRAEDALLQLANLEQARGDRRGASDLLHRFLLTYADSPARPRVALSLVRLLFEQGPQQQARACEALRLGRDIIPPRSLELRNQLEYYAPRCAMVAEAPPARADTPAANAPTPAPAPADTNRPQEAQADTVRRQATHADTTRRQATHADTGRARTAGPPAAAFYSVQLAAYDDREAALRLANRLVERGIEARVDGSSRPFRVRVGRYGTRADAVQAAAVLKAQGHNGFVTLVGAR